MTILFLTMSKLISVNERGIYQDLIRRFLNDGHDMYIVCPCERRENKPTTVIEENRLHILMVKTLNVQKASIIEKGIGQVSMEYLFQRAIKKYLKGIVFDLILYSTPPITFTRLIENERLKHPSLKTYLMLKDIFPQNAVDLGMLGTSGIKGILYKFFKAKEKKLYELSDYIGCMSPANIRYLLAQNPVINPKKVEICPNSYDVESIDGLSNITEEERNRIRRKYALPVDKYIFIYGGNLGKPQGIPFLIKCLKDNASREDCHFVIVGGGTEYSIVASWVNEDRPRSVSLINYLPKDDYDRLIGACDVGLIFLDYRFTIPNYPSRLLPYLMGKKPVIAVTDPYSDIGAIAEKNGYGYWCPSNDTESFTKTVDKMLKSNIKQMGEKGYCFFLNNYTVANTYDTIMSHFTKS